MPAKPLCNLLGQKFGRLVPIEYVASSDPRGHRASGYMCRCRCGTVKFASTGHLLKDHTVSCGCAKVERIAAASLRHGGAKRGKRHPLYAIWQGVRERCRNPNHVAYANYGGRGVRVCAGFADFTAFETALGERPSDAHSVDRIEAGGHYSCGRCAECGSKSWSRNVRWATHAQQQRNRRSNVRVAFRGESLVVTDWATRLGIPAGVLRTRLLRMPVERAMTLPYRKCTGRSPERMKFAQIRLGLIGRCDDPLHRNYADYGGRGITVCSRWRSSLANFRDDMGPRPSLTHSIDRIENGSGYWCGKAECSECGALGRTPNCRWATRREQNQNRRNSTVVEWRGEKRTVGEHARAIGITAVALAWRLKHWPEQRALSTPRRRQRSCSTSA